MSISEIVLEKMGRISGDHKKIVAMLVAVTGGGDSGVGDSGDNSGNCRECPCRNGRPAVLRDNCRELYSGDMWRWGVSVVVVVTRSGQMR